MEREEARGATAPAGLRIGLAIQALDRLGGKERDALAIAAGLTARGHDVTVLTRSARLPIPAGIAIRETAAGGWSNHDRARRFARAVGMAQRAEKFDAVLSFDKLKPADAYYAADVCFAGRVHGINAWLPRYATYARLEAECLSAAGPDMLFLCRKQADEYRRHYSLDAKRALVLPPMIHDPGPHEFYERRAAVRHGFGIPTAATLAVSVAVYSRQKGLDRTIAALGEIPQLQLLAVGLKEPASEENLAANYGIGARARFLGYRDDVADILSAADVMLHPARLENTGLVILESLLAGVPVIASAACGFAEYIERFGAGVVLSEPFDPSEYIAAIRMATEPQTLAELKGRARDSAPRLRAEGGLERILEVVERTLRRRAAMQQSREAARRQANDEP